jgi:hypothetical protein
VEGSGGGSFKNVAEVLVLFLCGAQLVLGFCVLTILNLNEVDVTLPRFCRDFEVGAVCGR